MKRFTFVLAFLFIIRALFSQATYPTSMSFTFSGGNNMGAAIGNDCGNKDIDIVYNSTDGTMDVTVNKVCHSWSFLQHWMAGPYAPTMVFKNRYIELRIKSSAVHTGLGINFQVSGGNPDGSFGKSIPPVTYSINREDEWEIKLFKLGGTGDTIFKEIDYNFPNGFYKIDYIYYGDAAVPPVPTIDAINDKYIIAAGDYKDTLTGIAIPGRLYDGLIIEAKAKHTGFFKNISFVNQGSGNIDEANKMAVLSYTVENSNYKSDSIYVTLKDAIRGTSKSLGFKVEKSQCSSCVEFQDLDETNISVSVYPSVTNGNITIESDQPITGDLSIHDIYGKNILSQKVNSLTKEELNLDKLTPGFYVIKISDGKNIVTQKIVKE